MIQVYTDGGCYPNPGPGAWAYLIIEKDQRSLDTSAKFNTTNNEMELTAVKMALKQLLEEGVYSEPIELISDSKYVVDGINTWRKSWADGNWEKPPANNSLWKEISALVDNFTNLKVKWVRGHSGVAGNEICDQLCQESRQNLLNKKSR